MTADFCVGGASWQVVEHIISHAVRKRGGNGISVLVLEYNQNTLQIVIGNVVVCNSVLNDSMV